VSKSRSFFLSMGGARVFHVCNPVVSSPDDTFVVSGYFVLSNIFFGLSQKMSACIVGQQGAGARPAVLRMSMSLSLQHPTIPIPRIQPNLIL
jgi:hypothetical protein